MSNNRRNKSMTALAVCTICLGLSLVWAVALPTAEAGFEVPGDAPQKPIILEHATIHPMTSEVIEDGVLVIENGKIAKLGQSDGMKLPEGEDVTRIDLKGKHIYPGLIDADTTMGLIEIDAVRATNDMRESGTVNPNARGAIAFNPDSEMIPVARAGGVLITLTVPRGGLVSGRSSLMMLDGWSAVDMTLVPVVGTHVNWPSGPRRSRGGRDSGEEQMKERSERLDQIREFLVDARIYHAARQANASTAFDARLDSMVPVVSGESPMFVHANSLGQIQEAIAFGQRESLKIVIVGGYDAPQCADLLKKHDIPVIVTGTHRNPRRRHAHYDEPFKVPTELKNAGVKYCLAGYARFSASLVQNLAHQAGTAAAYGLGREEAVRAITQYPAEILDVADRVGSLSAGMDATLIVADGDILEVTTNVEHAFVQGRPVDLNNRHKRLWSKYKVKYERQQPSAN